MIYDIAIIGAGVVGGMLARELSRYKLSICIIEKEGDVAMGATKANSAIVHAGFDAKEGSLKARLNVRGSEMMEQVASELGVRYKRNGSLVVGFSGEDRKTLLGLLERGIKNGVSGLTLLEREEVLAIEPNIGDGVECALHAPTGGIICPYGLCIAAIGNAMDNGAELMLDSRVTSIERDGNGIFKVTVNEESAVKARYVVNCAGVYSDEVAKMAGDGSFTVSPRRGEYMVLDKECGGLVSHTVFRCPSKMGKGILVTPTVDGNLLLGPTAEDIKDKTDVDTTAEGNATVRVQAAEQVRGIPFGKVITSFAGLRTTGSTGDFIINLNNGFINAGGIESPGLSASPAIAEYIVMLLRDGGLDLIEKEDFSPYRRSPHWFEELSREEKNDIIKERPEYAHVICRCETVTEGEIIDAIRANPKPRDVDGVKRRTRSGMGRCQGGFCAPYVVELLAREMGCGYGEVTKFGGGSIMNVGLTKEGE